MTSKALCRHRTIAAEQQGYRCWYCGFPMWDADASGFAQRHGLTRRQAALLRCTAEHLTARQDGGTDRADNIVAACLSCNRLRHQRRKALTPESLRARVTARIGRGRWWLRVSLEPAAGAV
jgi:5-methylcytosine-specific restriction endonuclease McrA